MKKMNLKFVILILVMVILIVYLINNRHKPDTDQEIEKQISNAGSGAAPSSAPKKPTTKSTLGNDYTLKYGTRGREVGWVQYYYNKMIADPKGLTRLKQDNIYGSKTQSAVKSVLGKNTTSWTEWKRTLDAKTAIVQPTMIPVPGQYSYQVAESTQVVNPYAIKI